MKRDNDLTHSDESNNQLGHLTVFERVRGTFTDVRGYDDDGPHLLSALYKVCCLKARINPIMASKCVLLFF